jgi:hypothetical protein
VLSSDSHTEDEGDYALLIEQPQARINLPISLD